MRPLRTLAAVVAVLVVAVAGCDRPKTPPDAPAPDAGVSRSAGSPLATLTVRVQSDTIATSDLLSVDAIVTAADVARVSTPELPSTDALRVVESWASPSVMRSDGSVEQVWSFKLEPDLPGTFELPGTRVGVRNAQTGEVSFLTTEAIPITVRSLLDADDAAVSELRTVPAPPPTSGTITQTIGSLTAGVVLAAIVVLLLIAAGVTLLVRRNRVRSIIPGSRRELSRLMQSVPDLDGTARAAVLADASRILRRCIAERAGVDATTMTIAEMASACPEVLELGRIRGALEAVESHLFSGSPVEPDLAESVLRSIDQSLDELATFVPTKYVDPIGGVA